jgi:outer membrane receptor protein involved in Fe transport
MLANLAWWVTNLLALPVATPVPPMVANLRPLAVFGVVGEWRAWGGAPAQQGMALSLAQTRRSQRLGFVGYLEQARGFARSRVSSVEVAGVPREAVALDQLPVRVGGVAWRGGWTLSEGALLAQLGASLAEGGVVLSERGRREFGTAVQRWGRLRYAASAVSGGVTYDGEESRGETDLWTGSRRNSDASRWALGGEATRLYAAERLEVRVGSEVVRRSAHATSAALVSGAARSRREGLFAQARWRAGPWTALAALRWDDFPGASPRWSPRAGLALALAAEQSVFASYSASLREASLEQRAWISPRVPPLDLGSLERAFGLDEGFASLPILAVGNPRLAPERTRRWDLGYRGSWGTRFAASVGVWGARHEDLISGYLPGGPAEFPPYRLPASVDAEAGGLFVETLRVVVPATLLVALSNQADGRAVAVFSPRNVGSSRSEGFDGLFTLRWGGRWSTRLQYSMMDFEVDREAAGDPLLPNLPPHRSSLDVLYAGSRLSAFATARWQKGFAWISGPFRGLVPSYAVLDLGTDFELAPGWSATVVLENALDRRYFEAFGGDLLGRRAEGAIRVRW